MRDTISRVRSFVVGHFAIVFAVLYFAAGGVLSFYVPMFHGLDEAAHFNRSYQVADGGMRSDSTDRGVGGAVPVSILDNQTKAMDYIKGRDTPESYEKFRDWSLGQRVDTSKMIFKNYEGAALYAPVTYLPASLFIAIVKSFDVTVGWYLIGARIAMLLVFCVITGLSLYIVRKYKIKYLIMSFLLIPVVVFQSAVLSADTLATALAVLLFSLLYVIFINRNNKNRNKLVMAGLVTASLLSLVKFNYYPIALLSLIPVFSGLLSRLYAKEVPWRLISYSVAGFLAISGPVFLWNIQELGTANKNRSTRATVDTSYNPTLGGQVRYLVDNPQEIILVPIRTSFEYGKNDNIDLTTRALTIVGYNSKRLPDITVVLVTMSVLLAIMCASSEILKTIGKRKIVIYAVFSALASLGVFMSLYAAHTDVASPIVTGLQGRYFIPILLFAAMILVYMLPARKPGCVSERSIWRGSFQLWA